MINLLLFFAWAFYTWMIVFVFLELINLPSTMFNILAVLIACVYIVSNYLIIQLIKGEK